MDFVLQCGSINGKSDFQSVGPHKLLPQLDLNHFFDDVTDSRDVGKSANAYKVRKTINSHEIPEVP